MSKDAAIGAKVIAQKVGDAIWRNRSNILTGTAVLGTVGTAIVSGKNTAKATRKIDAAGAKTFKEKFKLVWKDYIPTGLAVIGTSASAIGSRSIDAKTIASLGTIAATTSKLYSSLQQAVDKTLNQEEQQTVANEQQKIMEERPDVKPDPYIQGTKRDGDQLFIDAWSGQHFYSTIDKVKLVEAKLKEEYARLRPPYHPGDNFINYDSYFVDLKRYYVLLGLQVPRVWYQGWPKTEVIEASDECPIAFFYSAAMANDDTEAAIIINFNKDPINCEHISYSYAGDPFDQEKMF